MSSSSSSGSASSSSSSIFDDSPHRESVDSEEARSSAYESKHKSTGKEPSAEQQEEEVMTDGDFESEQRDIFLDPTQASMIPDMLPGESDASQLAPGNNKENKKKRPVLQLTDMAAGDDADESGEGSDGEDIDDDHDPALRRATPNKKQVRDQQDELGT